MLKNKKVVGKILIGLLVLLGSAKTSWGIVGFMEVWDPKLEATIAAISKEQKITEVEHFVKTLTQLQDQYKQAQEFRQYWENIHGNWKDPLVVLKNARIIAATNGIDIKQLGWAEDVFSKAQGLSSKGEAINSIQKIIKGESEANNLSGMRDSVEEIYGDVPVTSGGAQVELAYQKYGEVMAQSGENKKAIDELLKDTEEIEKKMSDGGITPGNLDRYQKLLDVKKTRIAILQTKSADLNNQLQAIDMGMKASEKGAIERDAIKEREDRRGITKLMIFSPAVGRTSNDEE